MIIRRIKEMTDETMRDEYQEAQESLQELRKEFELKNAYVRLMIAEAEIRGIRLDLEEKNSTPPIDTEPCDSAE